MLKIEMGKLHGEVHTHNLKTLLMFQELKLPPLRLAHPGKENVELMGEEEEVVEEEQRQGKPRPQLRTPMEKIQA